MPGDPHAAAAPPRAEHHTAPSWHGVAALVAAVLAGVLMAVQSRMNGRFAEHAGALPAAGLNFASGLALLSLGLLLPRYRQRLARIPAAIRSGALRRWEVLGGTVGASVVAVQSHTVPLVGVAVFLIALVGGQTLSGLLIDRFGLGAAPRLALTPARLIAGALTVVGVVLAVTGAGGSQRLAVIPVVLSFLVGMAASVQQAYNGKITRFSRDATATAWVNFAVGCSALAVIGAVPLALNGWPQDWSAPWWAWLGGACGVLVVTAAAWAVQHSGVLLFAMTSVSSQLVAGVLIDLAAPQTRDRVTGQVIAGIVITAAAAAGAAVAARRARRAASG